jgi:8-oxo-dGTP pyrophosphatase MutT (NUDIX family)
VAGACQHSEVSDPERDVPPAIPAATVVLLRDGRAGLETLMLHRTSQVAFGGMWVFPGGRVDPEDQRPEDPDDETGARRAAAREAAEECALLLEPNDLVAFSHWTPPPETPRRYATWFFVARASEGDVLVDGGEIHDHAWLTPTEVLARRTRGEVDLAPPTFVTLTDLAAHPDVDAVLADAAGRSPLPRYETRWALDEEGAVAMWVGDAGYEANDPSIPGARHRLLMREGGWHLER